MIILLSRSDHIMIEFTIRVLHHAKRSILMELLLKHQMIHVELLHCAGQVVLLVGVCLKIIQLGESHCTFILHFPYQMRDIHIWSGLHQQTLRSKLLSLAFLLITVVYQHYIFIMAKLLLTNKGL